MDLTRKLDLMRCPGCALVTVGLRLWPLLGPLLKVALASPMPEATRPGEYGIKKKEEREAEAQAALEANAEGSLTRPKKAIPPGCGDEPEEEDESILDTVIKYLPGPLQDMFKK
ncbi:complexin-1 isoform 2-T2 [Molossus nigricans]